MKIRNWKKFQHYKNRKPPWIKLHRQLIDEDFEAFYTLDHKAAHFLVMIWLIASEKDGELPSVESLAFRLRIDSREMSKIINMLGEWIAPCQHDASTAIESCKQGSIAETETERETEEETERDLSLAPTTPKPIASFEAWWSGVQNKIAKKKASLAWNRVQKANNWPQEKWTSLAKALSSEQERLINSGASPIHPATWLNGERWNDDPAPTPISRPSKFTPSETHGRRPQTLQIAEPAPAPQRTQKEQEAIAEERKRAIDKILGKAVEITEFGN